MFKNLLFNLNPLLGKYNPIAPYKSDIEFQLEDLVDSLGVLLQDSDNEQLQTNERVV